MCDWGNSLPEIYQEYVNKLRWNSFFHQIDEIISFQPNSILEIGSGLGITRTVIKNVLKMNYDSMDINSSLDADYVGSVLEMPFPDSKYDVVCCFQVLEHLPFEDFEKGLSEMCRVAKKAVIISLPNANNQLRLHISIRNTDFVFNRWFSKKKKSKNHFWEIGLKGYEEKFIRKIIVNTSLKHGYKLKKDFRLIETPFHHFFILDKDVVNDVNN